MVTVNSFFDIDKEIIQDFSDVEKNYLIGTLDENKSSFLEEKEAEVRKIVNKSTIN